MTTPAERYAAFRDRKADPELAGFRALYDFDFDPFQVEACHALGAGHGVLVAAPTGSGKTVIGEYAVHLALAQGRKCFYTTPIKALSNQKYADLVRRYDSRTVGLLTGDNSINGDAPVVVMTTEVLRNMLYTGSLALSGLGYVVLDEVHYLADRSRGAVWEEVIIHLPESVRVVALSATVSNAEEFGEWLDQVRGGTEVIVDEHRPVPLWQHVLAGHRLYDLFTDDEHTRVNPELLRVAQRDTWIERKAPQRPGRGGHRPRRFPPAYRPDVISRLDSNGLLPAITFIFSRAGCDAAVEQCLVAGLRLTTPEEAEVIQQVAERRTADIPPEDLTVLGYGEWLAGLRRGIAAHHAGMLPAFKEVVEELFAAGLVRAVFATETLALGINMPARTVVIEKLDKWNGETHANLTAGEYTQLTGRAGRRGIDVEGHAVVLWQPGMDPGAVAGLASTRTYPLNSSFRPSYNMAVNLTGWAGRARAATLLESSFAQFQADRGVIGLTRQVRKNRQALDELAAAMSCDKGDFAEYAQLRRSLTEREGDLSRARASSRRAEAARSLAQLRPGDIIRVPGGRRAGLAVVLQPGLHPARGGNGNGRPADRAGRGSGGRGSGHDRRSQDQPGLVRAAGNGGQPEFTGPGPLVLTEGRQVKRLASRRKNVVDPLQLRAGDYVVHQTHGIGRFVELVQREVASGQRTARGPLGTTVTADKVLRDYLVIEYAPSKRGMPGDKLYVPTDQLDLLTRYVGGESPALSKMGGSDWAAAKGRARKAVRDIAVELVKLYSARMASTGHAFPPDTPWQRELEEAFPFVETPDQVDKILERTSIGLCPDTGHVIAGGGDPAELISRHAARIPYVHLKDIDTETGSFVPLGQGALDVDGVMGALTAAGYDGWITVELDAWDDPLAGAVASHRRLEPHLAGASNVGQG